MGLATYWTTASCGIRVHMHNVTKHLIDLDFVINSEKCPLCPAPQISFLGLPTGWSAADRGHGELRDDFGTLACVFPDSGGTFLSTKLAKMAVSLSSWGGTYEGRSMRRQWSKDPQHLHVDFQASSRATTSQ